MDRLTTWRVPVDSGRANFPIHVKKLTKLEQYHYLFFALTWSCLLHLDMLSLSPSLLIKLDDDQFHLSLFIDLNETKQCFTVVSQSTIPSIWHWLSNLVKPWMLILFLYDVVVTIIDILSCLMLTLNVWHGLSRGPRHTQSHVWPSLQRFIISNTLDIFPSPLELFDWTSGVLEFLNQLLKFLLHDKWCFHVILSWETTPFLPCLKFTIKSIADLLS